MTTAFWFWIVGAIIYVFAEDVNPHFAKFGTLGLYSSIVGLAAWFLGH